MNYEAMMWNFRSHVARKSRRSKDSVCSRYLPKLSVYVSKRTRSYEGWLERMQVKMEVGKCVKVNTILQDKLSYTSHLHELLSGSNTPAILRVTTFCTLSSQQWHRAWERYEFANRSSAAGERVSPFFNLFLLRWRSFCPWRLVRASMRRYKPLYHLRIRDSYSLRENTVLWKCDGTGKFPFEYKLF